jgi:hypothetical protein
MSHPSGTSGMPPYFGAPGFADSYWIELLFNQVPALNLDALDARLRSEVHGEVAVKVTGTKDGIVSIAFPDHLVNISNGESEPVKLPALINIVWNDSRIKLGDYKAALDQTWEWDGAQKVLGGCQYMMLIGDLTCSRLSYSDRFRLLTSVAVACTELAKPLACYWKEAGCLVEPARVAEQLARVCNVRLFNVGGGDHFMDTLGLAAIGLPDVELEFSSLDPSWVAGWLHGAGRYLFEQGDVIQDGDVIPAPVAGEHWDCEHTFASVEPKRTVIRVSPGPRNQPLRRGV